MYKKIYFMGIKGVGMATLAVMAKQAGFVVGGSDVEEEFITDKILKNEKIEIRIGFKTENPLDFFAGLNPEDCLFIATGAHDGFENVEAKWARSKNIEIISHGEAVGLFMSGKLFDRSDIVGISVSGAHGKTSISGMISYLLSKLGADPSYTVGTSEIVGFGAAGHYGLGKYFVAEADEYMAEKSDPTPKFLYQKPQYLIINNIDFDHPDFYSNMDAVKRAFAQLVSTLDSKCTLIVNGDDENVEDILGMQGDALQARPASRGKIISYGTGEDNKFVLKNFKQREWSSTFQVFRGQTLIGDFSLSIPGYHNAKNSLSAIALLNELGFSFLDIRRYLSKFLGVKRRLERIGETPYGVLVFDDYAHHPEEIRKTLEAMKAVYPDKKITVVFQAHTYERTKALMSEFATSFSGINELIILPTFVSARHGSVENTGEDKQFVERIRMFLPNVKLIETASDVVEYLSQNIKSPNHIVLTMGAGDVYHVAEKLITKNL